MNNDKMIQVTESEMFMLAAEMVMENMPLTNKSFRPKDKDECIELLEEQVRSKKLSLDWLRSVASANVSNVHCYIDMDEKNIWQYLGGLSRATHTREDFIKQAKDVQAKMEKGEVDFKIHKAANNRKGYGKKYF